ncbi:ankyrin repeat domain-containing protein SOWAHD [Spea bombifrons]|uniref:ankyrin repeat domain-containing protein SOWAHD n=1 Tax=Spea bombifrons TaxID=233779 RepID=UPI00234BAF72|nr:ankyrin repeat domain-containing protein SOWAHD [Spea bombifrons]XP_053329399.1 ankyrin repeat domain-containing protein SOWAHD [Spea bombifrons]
MDKELQPESIGWQDNEKEAGASFTLPKYRSLKYSNFNTQGSVAARSPKMRNAQSLNRTPSPATISKRKKGIRGSIWNTTGSLPFGGAWISAASFDTCDGQDDQQLDSGDTGFVLDPVEHAWMLMAAEGNYDELKESLQEDPSLLYKRDFVTGYSVIHWIVKHGHHEDLISVMDFSRANGYPLDINTRASGGLTPLHIAAMQGHGMLIKVLVGAYNANVHVRDQNGRKPWQYLRPGSARQFQELLGAPEDEENGAFLLMNSNNNCHSTTSTAHLRSDEVDSAPRMPITVEPFQRLFRTAYRFFKNW